MSFDKYMVMYSRDLLIAGAAGAAGVGQTIVLSKFLDGRMTIPLPLPYGLSKPSAFFGIVGGVAALAAAFYANKTGNLIRDPRMQYALMAYGGAALVSGIGSAVVTPSVAAMPAASAARMVPRRAVPQYLPQVQRRVVSQNIL